MDNLIKGEVTIESINILTNESIMLPIEYNDVSWANLKALFTSDNSTYYITLPNRRGNAWYNTNSTWRIALSETDFEQNILNYTMPITEAIDVLDGYPTWTPKVLITDKDYMTFVADIPPPVSNRYIRGVGLTGYYQSTSNTQTPFTYGRTLTNLRLTTPCFQNTSTLLRITYRLYFDDAIASPTKTNITDSYYPYIKSCFKAVSDGSNSSSDRSDFYRLDLRTMSSYYDLSIPDNFKVSLVDRFMTHPNHFKMTDTSLYTSGGSSRSIYLNGSVLADSFNTLTDTVTMGTFFRNIVVGGGYPDGGGQVLINKGLLYQRAVPDTASPLQNLYKMTSSGNNIPLLNASYLSNMSGDITIGVSGWIQQPYPKLFRIMITNSGGVGVATYKVQVMKFTAGFVQNTFCPREALLPQDGYDVGNNSYFRKNANEQIILENVQIGGTAFRTPDDNKYMVAANCQRTKDCIALYNIETGDKTILDSTTLAGFNANAVSDIAVSGGFTFVTCADTGLWKIDTSFTTATHVTVAGVDDTKAYQIDVKSNGDLWVLFDGGLAQSTDLGSTWTVYNPTSSTVFSAAGITDNNYNNVTSMIIDPVHANDRILFVLGTGGGTYNANGYTWWDRVSATSTKPTTGIPQGTFSLTENLKRSDLIRCVGGVWFSHHCSSVDSPTAYYSKELFYFTYGSSNFSNAKTMGSSIWFSPRVFPATVAGVDGFFIGCGHNQYAFNGGYGTTSAFFVNSANANSLPSTITPSSSVVEFFTRFGSNDISSDMRTYNQQYLSTMGSIPLCYFKNSNMMIYGSINTYNDFRVAPLIIDPSITNYNTYKSACWEEYGWNGSNWVIGNSNSKTCHSASEALIDGLTISFTNGVSGTSFINTDFYSFVVGNGVMKDNLTTYNYKIPYYNDDTEVITDFEVYSALPDNKVLFVPASSTNINHTNSNFGYSYKRGRISSSSMNNYTFYSEQRADASTPFTLKFKPIATVAAIPGKWIGVADSSSGANVLAAKFLSNGVIGIRDSGNNTVATITGITYTTELTFERTAGNLIKVYDASIVSGLGSSSTPYYTSGTLSNAMVVHATMLYDPFFEMGWYDVTFDSTDTSVFRVICGDSGTSTGIFNSKFTGISCTDLLYDAKIYVNGIQQTIINNPLTIPTTGQVRLGAGGALAFPNAVSGSTITGYVTAHYHP